MTKHAIHNRSKFSVMNLIIPQNQKDRKNYINRILKDIASSHKSLNLSKFQIEKNTHHTDSFPWGCDFGNADH